ncbi:MAG: CRP/FNR family transcriptional regulator [Oleiphilaceae bacterium]|jgi:CRP/FNR family transcriptional regulator
MSNQSYAITHSYQKCGQCGLSKLCLPLGLDSQDMGHLENIIEASSPYNDNQSVFHADQNFERIYAVKSGMFKTVVIDANGNEHILGFHLPGELFGLDAIYPKKYISTAISLGTSSVCGINYTDLESLAGKLPSLQRQLFNLMSKEVHTSQALTVEHAADQKLAGFILTLSRRYKERGYSETRINLMMPRRDIANHLNMAAETVSRLFKRFQKEGLLDIKRTDLQIIDMEALKRLAGCAPAC